MGGLEQARKLFDSGDFQAARETALAALRGSGEDLDLLRVAGLAGVECGASGAADELRRVADGRPDDAVAWRELGDALATEGRIDEAREAFGRAAELDPADETALTALGHAAYTTGDEQAALAYLEKAADRGSGATTASISLVEMYRTVGQLDDALAAALRIAEAEPDDVLAALDVAELSLETGRYDAARAAFDRLRHIDDLPEHDVYALHGMVASAMGAGDWPGALALAEAAQQVDAFGRTAPIVAFLGEAAAGPGPGQSRDDVEAALRESLSEHRRLHADDRRLGGDELRG